MKKPYHIVTRAARESAAVIEQFCQSNGQILLPIVHLIESASQVVETVLHEIQVHSLEAILVLSAEPLAGARTPGKASGDIRHPGSQAGRVQRADRKIKLKRPRLRHKSQGEVKIPAYEALRQDRGLSQHRLGALLRGISTRGISESLAADGGHGGSVPERHPPAGHRSPCRTTPATARCRNHIAGRTRAFQRGGTASSDFSRGAEAVPGAAAGDCQRRQDSRCRCKGWLRLSGGALSETTFAARCQSMVLLLLAIATIDAADSG